MNAGPADEPAPLPYADVLRRVKDLRAEIQRRRKAAPDAASAEPWKAWERHISEELRSHPLNDDLVRLAERLQKALKNT